MNSTAHDQVRAARAVLLDWDGCIVESGVLKPGARAFLDAFSEKISILSNNSTARPAQIAAFLARARAPIPAGRIHLAGQAALEEAARRVGARPVFLMANSTMTRAALRLGLEVAPRADHAAVVLLRDTGFTYRKLETAVQRLRRGAPLIVANPDLTHPRGDEVVPETGALMAAIAACVDLSGVDATVIGKPSAPLFERALAAAGAPPQEALMIGDNPATDLEGARRLGIPAILLGPTTGLSLDAVMASGRGRSGQGRTDRSAPRIELASGPN